MAEQRAETQLRLRKARRSALLSAKRQHVLPAPTSPVAALDAGTLLGALSAGSSEALASLSHALAAEGGTEALPALLSPPSADLLAAVARFLASDTAALALSALANLAALPPPAASRVAELLPEVMPFLDVQFSSSSSSSSTLISPSGGCSLAATAVLCVANVATDGGEAQAAAAAALPALLRLLGTRDAGGAAFALAALLRGRPPVAQEAVALGAVGALEAALLSLDSASAGVSASTSSWASASTSSGSTSQGGAAPWGGRSEQRSSGQEGVEADLLWVCVYLGAARGAAGDAVRGSDALLSRAAQRAGGGDALTALPALRILGNAQFCASAPARAALSALPAALGGDAPRLVRREALWVLSLCLAEDEVVHDALAAGHVVVALAVDALVQGTLDVKKDAAYCVMNITNRRERLQPFVDAFPQVLPPMIALMRSPDAEAQVIALDFAERVLIAHPRGRAIIEELDGIDAIESLQYIPNNHLAQRSYAIVDRFFGLDADAEN